MKNQSFSYRSRFLLALLLVAPVGAVMLPAAGAGEPSTASGAVMAAEVPTAVADRPKPWLDQFRNTFMERLADGTISVQAVRLTFRAVQAFQLSGDAEQDAQFCAQLANQVDIALRMGASPTLLAQEVAAARMVGRTITSGPLGSIDRSFNGTGGANGAFGGGPQQGGSTGSGTGVPPFGKQTGVRGTP